MSGVGRENRGKRPSPFPLRLSDEEREFLVRSAGNMALGSYIKAKLFGDVQPSKPKARQRTLRLDQKLLAEILACVASSRLKERLDELAELGRNGGLQFDPDAPRRIKQACADIHAVRVLLMQALGFREQLSIADETVSQAFLRASADI